MNLQRISQLSMKFKACPFINISKIIMPRLFYSSAYASKCINIHMTGHLQHQFANTLVTRPTSLYQGIGDFVKPITHIRYFSSSESEEPSTKTENQQLMDAPLIVWPSIINTIRNWVFAFFIIKPFYENDFSLPTFSIFSRKAVVKVSEILSSGDFKTLEEFVEEKALQEVRKNYSLMNFKERLRLAIAFDDVFFYFPYQIGIIFTDSNKGAAQRVFVEITMCYHIFHGLKDYLEQAQKTNAMKPLYDSKDRVSIANYRFIKEVTKGTEDQWTINLLNHFNPSKVAPRF